MADSKDKKHRRSYEWFGKPDLALPQKVLKKGITDMVRISDARMSGTAYGTVVIHAGSRTGR